METVIVTRNGETKLRVPAEIRNGVLRHGKNILINGDLLATSGLTKDEVKTKIKKGDITPEIEAMGMKIGDNGNGLVCRWAKDVRAEENKAREAIYNALPADVRAAREERKAIDKLYYQSDRSLNHDRDDNNVMRGYGQQSEADKRLKVWREKYPHAAAKEKAELLLTKADREDSLASGALTYDADGWIGPEEQQRRHDEYKKEADDLRQKAQSIIENLPDEWK